MNPSITPMWQQQRVIDNLRAQIAELKVELQRYKTLHGELPE